MNQQLTLKNILMLALYAVCSYEQYNELSHIELPHIELMLRIPDMGKL